MRLPPPTGKLVWHCASRHRTPRSVGAVRGVETSGDGVAAVEASDQRCGFLHVLGRVDVAAVIAVGLIDEVPGQHRRMVLVLLHLGHAAKAQACRLRNDPRRSGWLRIDSHGRSTDCRAPLAHSAHFGSQRTVLQPCSIAAAGAPKIKFEHKVRSPAFHGGANNVERRRVGRQAERRAALVRARAVVGAHGRQHCVLREVEQHTHADGGAAVEEGRRVVPGQVTWHHNTHVPRERDSSGTASVNHSGQRPHTQPKQVKCTVL